VCETVAWRGPIGDSGLLDFFLGCLARDTLRQGFYIHALRLIGNSCADTDENRARVVQGNHITSIIRLLQDQSLIPFTIPVLFNILVDYGEQSFTPEKPPPPTPPAERALYSSPSRLRAPR
jgi:hypothetical protein